VSAIRIDVYLYFNPETHGQNVTLAKQGSISSIQVVTIVTFVGEGPDSNLGSHTKYPLYGRFFSVFQEDRRDDTLN
jgi:hypothetical protein